MNNPPLFPNLIPNVQFNLNAQELFVKDHGIIFEHFAALPSPIGLKDRGEYRRSDALDVISSNGFIYKKVGEFTGIIVNNSSKQDKVEGGVFDNSVARLVLPKFYNDQHPSKTKEISLLPGDRVYAKGIELKVDNYQRVQQNPTGQDYLQFPAKDVSMIVDSQNNDYTHGINYQISKDGNICWIDGKKSPGIDPDTGNGRVYSIRYTYLAFWYVSQLINEIRVTNNGSNQSPARMPYQVQIQREYVYHNQVRSENVENTKKTERTIEKPTETIDPNKYDIKVNIDNFKE
jgi:hypothetical protein